jgi:hypothetical protein
LNPVEIWNFRKFFATLLTSILLVTGCPSDKKVPDSRPGLCGMLLTEVRGVRLEKLEPVPVIRVIDFPASFMIANKLSPGNKTCTFELTGPQVRPEQVFFRRRKSAGVNRGKLTRLGPDRVRVSYTIRERSYGVVLNEPVASAPRDPYKFSHFGLRLELSGGAFLRLVDSVPLVRSLGPQTVVRITNPTGQEQPLELVIDNTSERLSTASVRAKAGPCRVKVERVGPLTVRAKGKVGPGQELWLSLRPVPLKRPFSFIFGGDIKQEIPVFLRLLAKVQKSSNPLFMLAIGDYTRNCLPWEYSAYFKATAHLPFPVYYVKGNHETLCQGDVHYKRLFGPERFSLVVADLLFVILDSNESAASGYRLRDDQLSWLDRVLTEQAKLPWKMVALHAPPHPLHGSPPKSPYLYNMNPDDAQALKKLAAKHHVSHVLSGHAHLYARGTEDGVVYLTSGGAGASLYTFNLLDGFVISTEKHLMVMHVLEDSIEEEKIDLSPHNK